MVVFSKILTFVGAFVTAVTVPFLIRGYLRGDSFWNRGFEFEGRSLGALLMVLGFLGVAIVFNYGACVYIWEYLKNRKGRNQDKKLTRF